MKFFVTYGPIHGSLNFYQRLVLSMYFTTHIISMVSKLLLAMNVRALSKALNIGRNRFLAIILYYLKSSDQSDIVQTMLSHGFEF